MDHEYTVIQVVYWIELPEQRRLCPEFCENMDLDKWETTVWYRITQNPQEFHGLTGCQQDPRVLRRHRILIIFYGCSMNHGDPILSTNVQIF